MKKYNIKTRYFFSVVIDFVIIYAVIIPFSYIQNQMEFLLFAISMFLIVFLILSQDKLLKGASIGKRLLGIKMISYEGFKEITLGQTLIRRFLEMLYSYKIIIWGLYINIDKISHSKIVHKSYNTKKNNTNNNVLSSVDHKLIVKREKSFLIDFLFILPVIIISYIIKLNYFENVINNYNDNLYFWINYIFSFLIILYFVFKDYTYKNASIGKKKYGLRIVDRDGKTPSKLQMLIRGFVQVSIWPVEIILFLLNKRQVAEMITYTKVIQDSNV